MQLIAIAFRFRSDVTCSASVSASALRGRLLPPANFASLPRSRGRTEAEAGPRPAWKLYREDVVSKVWHKLKQASESCSLRFQPSAKGKKKICNAKDGSKKNSALDKAREKVHYFSQIRGKGANVK